MKDYVQYNRIWHHIRVLQYFIDLYDKDPAKLFEQAENVTNGIQSIEQVPKDNTVAEYGLEQLDRIFGVIKSSLDTRRGGMNRAPKFPMPSVWEYLMHYHYLGNNPEALKSVIATLDNMAMGGIYDQVGGGFARYSTDENWHVPHFEKML